MWPYFPELLAHPVPRYTSYPTAAEFDASVGAAEQERALTAAKSPVSLYVHIPYCTQICWYCGCNTGAANKQQRLNAYLEALEREIAEVAALVPPGRTIGRIAFGGGSPNAIAPLAFVRLLDRLLTCFGSGAPDMSIEIDPRSFGPHWAGVIGAVGLRNASLGVQTFADHVQQRIGRVQPQADIARTVDLLRQAGVTSLNFDLMYGLPGQSRADLAATLETALAMRPERIALFGYAHVPAMLPRQRQIDASALPEQMERFLMAADGYDLLVGAGYQPVGFDHFALPDDPMAIAAREGRLHRNFQGFTDDRSTHLIGLGASAISIFPDVIVQNEKNAGRYRMRLSDGRLTGALGATRSAEDRRRGTVIEDILCGRPADLSGLPGGAAAAAAMLAPFLERGVASLDGARLSPTVSTRPYARSIAACFDAYRAPAETRFSTAV